MSDEENAIVQVAGTMIAVLWVIWPYTGRTKEEAADDALFIIKAAIWLRDALDRLDKWL